MPPYTRRGVLASLGLGGAGAASLAILSDSSPYTDYTYAQSTGDDRVQVAWYELYNGRRLEHQGGTTDATANDTLDPAESPRYVPEVSGPVISLQNVMPGDHGRLAIGISLAERPEGSGPLTLDLTGRLLTSAENGRTEPERKAGDTSDTDGELPAALDASVWIDDGPFACDGSPLLDPTIAEGSLDAVFDTLSSGFRLCEACFRTRTAYCLGVRWTLPESTGNAVQSDGVTFELAVEAHDREAES